MALLCLVKTLMMLWKLSLETSSCPGANASNKGEQKRLRPLQGCTGGGAVKLVHIYVLNIH